MLPKITGLFRLAVPAEVLTFEGSKQKLVKMFLICSEVYFDKNGDKQENVCTQNAEYWISEKSTLPDYFPDTDQLMITGDLLTNSWKNEKGEKRSQNILRVSQLDLVGKKKGAEDQNSKPDAKPVAKKPTASASKAKEPIAEVDEDEIPF